MSTVRGWVLATGAAVAALAPTGALQAAQFSFLDAAYQQEIYTGRLIGGPGMAWTAGGNLLTRDGALFYEYSPTADITYNGNAVHSVIATHSVTGLLAATGSSIGIVNGTDGFIYATTGGGLQRIDPNTWIATTVVGLPGSVAGHYGITVLPDGRIVYVTGGAVNEIHLYDPVGLTDTLIYTAGGLIDDIQASPGGLIALAGQGNNNIEIITDAGVPVITVPTTSFPDGLAFGWGATVNKLFSNDNQGTITEYDFNVGFTSLLGTTVIASGGSYGDLAAVGPDCALYVSQFYNGGYHGSALFGTNWNAGTDNDPSIVRISARDGSCAFAPSGGTHTVAEPTGMPLLATGLAALLVFRRRPGRNGVHPAPA